MADSVQLIEELLQITLPILPSPRSALPLAAEVEAEPIMSPDAATIALLKRQCNKIVQPLEIDKHARLLCAPLNLPRAGNSVGVSWMLCNNPPAARFQSVSYSPKMPVGHNQSRVSVSPCLRISPKITLLLYQLLLVQFLLPKRVDRCGLFAPARLH